MWTADAMDYPLTPSISHLTLHHSYNLSHGLFISLSRRLESISPSGSAYLFNLAYVAYKYNSSRYEYYA